SGAGGPVARSGSHSGRSSGLHLKQLYLIGLGLLGLLASLAVDYRRLADRAVLLYLLGLGALTYVLLAGPRIAQTRRWVMVGGFQLQPSELVKIAAALFVAKVFAEMNRESLGLREIAGPGAAVGLLAVLIAAEPDLGTAFCLVPLFL